MHAQPRSLVLLAMLASGCASKSPTVGPASPTAPDPAARLASDEPAGTTSPVPAGYKVRVRDGETLYCRTVTPLGTRFAQQVCMTVAQYEDLERRDTNMQQDLSRQQKSIDAPP
jgi:hypothetical protein